MLGGGPTLTTQFTNNSMPYYRVCHYVSPAQQTRISLLSIQGKNRFHPSDLFPVVASAQWSFGCTSVTFGSVMLSETAIAVKRSKEIALVVPIPMPNTEAVTMRKHSYSDIMVDQRQTLVEINAQGDNKRQKDLQLALS